MNQVARHLSEELNFNLGKSLSENALENAKGVEEYDEDYLNRNMNNSNTNYIGRRNTGAGQFKGYLSNFRIIKGEALYAENFTPPSALLTG